MVTTRVFKSIPRLAVGGLCAVAMVLSVLSLRSRAQMVPCYWDIKADECVSGSCELQGGWCAWVQAQGECICFTGTQN